MVFSLMLRFIPSIADEAQAVVDAQTARGGGLAEGSPLRRIRAVVPVVVALLASSLRHANGLSRALDARCYEGGASRSHWHPLCFHSRDLAAGLMTCGYVVTLLLLHA
jgi:energy-coupling factor transporter transmembrane protein EcfT